ncbi:MAG: hypothetical protein MJ229_07900, partial [bacterium]|nr:hypothetical protein [bacterium]
MWTDLPENEKNEYKKMILAFASLTEMFAQKAEADDENEILSPIINSKYQETVFQKAFNASAEDIGNTSYDAALCKKNADGSEIKYLIGIKTFGIASGSQKIAQFKANHDEWSETLNEINNNAKNSDNSKKTKEEINQINANLYLDLAKKIAELRNLRISSSIAKLKGFSVEIGKDNVQTVYHVLMPSKKGDLPYIYVGETSYNQIDVENLKIIGCTSNKNPTNFDFNDGIHNYRFTSADSQLLMDFKNQDIVKDKWQVIYAENAYDIFAELADKIYSKKESNIIESHSWLITNEKGEIERYSGFNNFFGLGSKLGENQREEKIEKLYKKYENLISEDVLQLILDTTKHFLLTKTSNSN